MTIRLQYRGSAGNKPIPVHLPASKSMANRLLILQHLYAPKLQINNLSDAHDTQLLHNILQQLPENIDIEDAGTACRFMIALLSITPGTRFLSGTKRMQQRPIKKLAEALQTLGADITYTGREGFLPLKITGKVLEGGSISITNPESSQFISALMLIAPRMTHGLTIHVEGRFLSASYTRMTQNVMTDLGFRITSTANTIHIEPFVPQHFPVSYNIESDWSAAGYFYGLSALLPGHTLQLYGLQALTVQGDGQYLLEHDVTGKPFDGGIAVTGISGQPYPVTIDCSDIPDLALPLIVRNTLLKLPSLFTGLETLQAKESNRTEAIAAELQKLQVSFRQTPQGWELDPIKFFLPENMAFDTYNDHRMAMALSLFAVAGPIVIRDEGVVKKSFPAYWQQLETLNFAVEPI